MIHDRVPFTQLSWKSKCTNHVCDVIISLDVCIAILRIYEFKVDFQEKSLGFREKTKSKTWGLIIGSFVRWDFYYFLRKEHCNMTKQFLFPRGKAFLADEATCKKVWRNTDRGEEAGQAQGCGGRAKQEPDGGERGSLSRWKMQHLSWGWVWKWWRGGGR